MDFEVQRCTRHCAKSARELGEGEVFFSVLVPQGARVERLDYAAEAWTGPPAGAIAWWQSRMPTREAKKARMAPNDVLLELFHELREQPHEAEMVYVLALLLVRRRVLRIEASASELGNYLELYCPREEVNYRVRAAVPSPQRTAEIEQRLASLLYATTA